jgi:LacI family transcriptional regulator
MDIREIAKRAKVSTATVSRTINRVPTVHPQLAKRVWKVVDELGYYPNTQARSLVSGRSRIFGLIVSEITNPFFPEIVQSFEDIAIQHDYEIMLTSTVYDPKRMALAVRRMIERRVDGVAILTFGMEDSLIADLRFRKLPLVFVDVGPAVAGVGNIRIDYQNGIRQAVQHLAALRHVRIAFVSGPLHLKSALARKSAFEESMREIGLEALPELMAVGDHTMEGGMRALAKLAALHERPTGVVCSNDMSAIGVMREAYDCGISIPRDLSVVGFDDIRLAQFMSPPLTTVQMSQTELARLAFHALMNEVQRHSAAPPKGSEYRLNTNLIMRKSTALAAPQRKPEGH